MGRLKSFFHDEIAAQADDIDTQDLGPYITSEAYDNISIDGQPLVAVLIRRDTATGSVALLGAYTDRMDAEWDLSLMLMGKRLFSVPDSHEFSIQSVVLTDSPAVPTINDSTEPF